MNRLFPLIFLLSSGCGLSAPSKPETPSGGELAADPHYQQMRMVVAEKYSWLEPIQWGDNVPRVKRRLKTEDRVIALTLDACGSENDGYDSELIEFLRKEQIPKTLFISGRWIDKNPATFMDLARDPLFDIGNHGLEHKPSSVNGRSIYGLVGTESAAEVIDEVELNARKIEQMTGVRPRFYRSGTAFYDEVATQISEELGQEVVGFDIVGDAGASFSKERVEKALLQAIPGSIIIAHMNRPARETAEGIMRAVQKLRERGFAFVRLSDYELVEVAEDN